MFNLGSKAFFGIAGVAFAMAVVYAFISSDYTGVVLLLVATGAFAGLGGAALAGTGSADRFALAQSEQSSADQPTSAPLFAALGIGFVGLGVALGTPAFVGGLVVAALALIGWFSASWRSHPDVVARMQPRIADRFSLPFLMPLAVFGVILVVAVSISRSFLATSATGSWVLAAVLGVIVFIGLVIWAWKPDNKVLRQGLVALTLVSIVALAIVGLALGERDFHHHEGEKGESHSEAIRLP